MIPNSTPAARKQTHVLAPLTRPSGPKFHRRNPRKVSQILREKVSSPTPTPSLLIPANHHLAINTTLAGVAQSVERVALITAKRSTSRSWVRAPPSAIPISQASTRSSCSFALFGRPGDCLCCLRGRGLCCGRCRWGLDRLIIFSGGQAAASSIWDDVPAFCC